MVIFRINSTIMLASQLLAGQLQKDTFIH